MGDQELPNVGLRFNDLGSMKSLIDGLLLTQDSVTVRAGDVTVTAASYREVYDQLDRALPRDTNFLDGARMD
jgi:hypothetical protein